MLKEISLLFIIYSFSVFYNNYISKIILYFIPYNIYNNLIISLIILIQIDNYVLYMDYKNKEINLIRDINMENFNIIINNLKKISYENKITKMNKIIRMNKINKSCNNLEDLR